LRRMALTVQCATLIAPYGASNLNPRNTVRHHHAVL
jgi:hypothetical protein